MTSPAWPIHAFACVLALLLGGACNNSSSGEPAQRDEPSGGEHTQPSKPGKSAEKPAGTTELITDKLVRPAGGRALLLLPELPQGWSLEHKHNAGVRGVMLFRGTPTDFSGFITLLFLPPTASPQQAHEQFVGMMKGGIPHMQAKAAAAPLAGRPQVLAESWAGRSESGVDEAVWIATASKGDASVGVFVRSQAGILDSQMRPLADALLAGVRLGDEVPRLPDQKPSERLSGIWEAKSGLRIDWLVFDPRGYSHMGSPNDPSWLDLDACLALGRGLHHYQIANGQITFAPYPADPGRTTYKWSFAHSGTSLKIEDSEYRRIDEAPVKIVPGTWEYYESSSGGGSFAAEDDIFEFAADGTYKYSGEFTYSHNQPSLAQPGTDEWSMAGYAAQAPASGRWKVEGHTLVLSEGKHSAVRTLYASQHSNEILYIGGYRYVKMK